jgi:hypothetical protein
MGEDEDQALAAYRAALGGERRRTKRSLTTRMLAVASVLAVGGAVAVGALFFTRGDQASRADPTGYRDPSLCEVALQDTFDTEAEAIADG